MSYITGGDTNDYTEFHIPESAEDKYIMKFIRELQDEKAAKELMKIEADPLNMDMLRSEDEDPTPKEAPVVAAVVPWKNAIRNPKWKK